MKNRIIPIFLLLACGPAAWGQMRTNPIDKLDWQNPWLGSGNMSGMSYNNFLEKEKTALTEAAIGADYENGAFRNVYDPEKAVTAGVGIESYSKLDKVFLYGRFNYAYQYSSGNSWRGSIHPYDKPFMLADNVPGNISDETYDMQAGIGIRFGKFSLGFDISYYVGIMAKQKDLRNRNTDMLFCFAPGISYDSGHVRLGLNAGYRRGTEKVEYTQIAGDKENYLYYIYGMWLYNSYGYSSAETSRFTGGNTAFGNFQIDANAGNVRIFNNFGADYRISEQGETGYNNLRYGAVRDLTLSDRLVLQIAEKHRITATYSNRQMSADRFLQQQELDPDSGIRRWKDYGGNQLCWSRKTNDAGIDYHFRDPLKWEIYAGAAYSGTEQIYSSFPLTFRQKFVSVEPYLGASKFFYGSKTRWELEPRICYRFMNEVVRNEISVPEGVVYESSGTIQLEEPLAKEADFFGNDRLGASVGLTCDFWRMYIAASYGFFRAPSLNQNRHAAQLKVGIAF